MEVALFKCRLFSFLSLCFNLLLLFWLFLLLKGGGSLKSLMMEDEKAVRGKGACSCVFDLREGEDRFEDFVS